jgi:hypothetical protein
MRSITLAHVGYDYMNSRSIHDQTFTGCSISIMGCTQENRILRNKLGARVPLTEADRRILVRYGLRIKDRLAEVISIVQPETLLAWNRQQKQKKWTFQNNSAKAGRPRKTGDTEALIVRLAQENNGWGYKRISGS